MSFVQKKFKVSSILLAVVFLVSLILPGCANIGFAPEPVEITFKHNENDTAYYQAMVNSFNKQASNITIKLVTAGEGSQWGDDYLSGADCYATYAFSMMRFQYINSNNDQPPLLYLDEFIAADDTFNMQDFYPGVMSLVRNNRGIWGIPAGVNPVVMYYNQDLFDRSGVQHPRSGWTWQDFQYTAAALRDPATEVWGFAPGEYLMTAMLVLYQHGGSIVDNMQDPQSIVFNSPVNVEALEWYTDLFSKYEVAPAEASDLGQANSYDGAATLGILDGRVAMWTGTYEERGGTFENLPWPFRWSMVSLPQDETAASYADGDVYAISAASEHPDACWKWISYLSTHSAKDARMAPARRSVAESLEYEELVGAETAEMIRQTLEVLIIPPSIDRLFAMRNIFETFEYAVESATTGRMTPQEALDYAQKEAGN
jgi:ABC-type glycerol-3-phosphate transport system substrate-binding protein